MSLYVKTGSYTGSGSGTNTITLDHPAKAFFIWGPAQASITAFGARIKTNTMGANDSKGTAGQIYTDGNITFSGNDVVLGGTSTNGMNISAKEYHWLALGGTGCVTGSYTGSGADNRDITGLGIDPDLVIAMSINSGDVPTQKTTSSVKTTDTSRRLSSASYAADKIQALITDGFQVGTSTDVNRNTALAHYIAIQKDGNSTIFNEGTYTGTGADNRDITGVGFNPTFVFANRVTTPSNTRVRSAETTDTASSLSAANTAVNTIQSLITDGFQIGSSADVNANTETYYWFAFADGESVDVSNTSNFFQML